MKRHIASLVAILSLVATALAEVPASRPSTQPAERPFRIVELRGDPAQLGTQHGEQLAESIKALETGYLARIFPGKLVHGIVLKGADAYQELLLPEHRQEIMAGAKAAGVDEREAMLGNCFLDMLPIVACSTISLPAAGSPDGVARFARNLDFPSLNIADKYSTLIIYHPKDRFAFASVTWPGLVGVLSGMNEHGLVLCNMEVARLPRSPQAMPYVMLYRSVMEQCKTVDEAIAFVEKAKRQSANNVLLMDATGARAVMEITPEAVHIRRAKETEGLFSTNHQRGDGDEAGLCRRYDFLNAASAARFGRIDEKTLEMMLGRVAQGRNTLQSMIFEPANRVLYLAVGEAAPTGEFHKVDLKPYFKK